MDPRGTVGRIYKGEYYTCTLVHTTYESSGPYVFGEEDFFYVPPPPVRSLGAWLAEAEFIAGLIKRTTIHCYTQKSSGLCGFGEENGFPSFFHDAPGTGPVWTPRARLAGFIKRTTLHCYTQNMKALGLVVSEKKIFLCFSHCKSMGANDPRGGAIFCLRDI